MSGFETNVLTILLKIMTERKSYTRPIQMYNICKVFKPMCKTKKAALSSLVLRTVSNEIRGKVNANKFRLMQ